MSGPTEMEVLAGVLADAGLKATLVLGAGWVATRLVRGGSAAQRHAIWATSLLALPLLPALAAQRGAEIALEQTWIVGVWAVGALAALLPLVVGLLRLAWLKAEATPDPRSPRLRHSPRISGPLTWGLLRPVILLPASARDWTPAQRAAALAHEEAHIDRKDWAVHLAVWAVCAVFWFHPLVWLARRSLAQEAEHAADDAVLDQGVRPSDYATLLLTLARTLGPRAALGLGPSQVGTRVRAVLATRSRSPRRWPAWVLAAVLLGLSLPALGAFPTWTAPQDTLQCR